MALILFVDDDPGARQTFDRILRNHGHSVLTAEGGRQALALVIEQKPDLLVIDLMLPDMSATDVIRGLRSEGITTPIIVITGFGSVESAVSAMKLGALDYLTKPVYEEDLMASIDRAFMERPRHLPALVRADGLTRWAMAVASALDAVRDPRTLEEWANIRAVAPETLRGWCRTAALSPKASLDLARILRAVWQARARGWPFWRLLDAADQRTLHRLLALCGVSVADAGAQLPTLGDVLNRQHFITDSVAIHELRRVLQQFNIDPDNRLD